jgi:hypothetical protein
MDDVKATQDGFAAIPARRGCAAEGLLSALCGEIPFDLVPPDKAYRLGRAVGEAQLALLAARPPIENPIGTPLSTLTGPQTHCGVDCEE